MRLIIVALFSVLLSVSCTQFNTIESSKVSFIDGSYKQAFHELDSMLDDSKPIDYMRAVFVSENAYHKDSLDYSSYCKNIEDIVVKLKWFINAKRIEQYNTSSHYAVYSYLCEPSIINDSLTYKYDFEDFMGYDDWTNMFVTKLMETRKGNCHSLPYLFKILTEEMGVDSYLAMAPGHVYIKHRDESGKWINIELTNGGGFSSDAWIISSMGITSEAIKSGIYMSPLTLKESIALCIYDPAMGYKEKYGHDDTVEMMCDTILGYYPNCIMALMLKSDCTTVEIQEILKKKPLNDEDKEEFLSIKKKYIDIQENIANLGYTDMPEELYEKWSKSVEEELKKQENSENSSTEKAK